MPAELRKARMVDEIGHRYGMSPLAVLGSDASLLRHWLTLKAGQKKAD